MERVRRVRSVAPLEESEPSLDDPSGPQDLDDEASDAPQEGETEAETANRIRDKYKERATTPLKAIRAFCVSCMGDAVRMVAKCTATGCVLYPYRMGFKPKKEDEE